MKGFLGCLGILLFMLIVGGFFVGSFTVSWIGWTNGTHSGIVTAVETNTLIWETRRAYFKTSLESTQEDTYCIKDLTLYENLSKAAQTGERLTIRFAHPLIEWRWNCSNDQAIIVGIEPSPPDSIK